MTPVLSFATTPNWVDLGEFYSASAATPSMEIYVLSITVTETKTWGILKIVPENGKDAAFVPVLVDCVNNTYAFTDDNGKYGRPAAIGNSFLAHAVFKELCPI